MEVPNWRCGEVLPGARNPALPACCDPQSPHVAHASSSHVQAIHPTSLVTWFGSHDKHAFALFPSASASPDLPPSLWCVSLEVSCDVRIRETVSPTSVLCSIDLGGSVSGTPAVHPSFPSSAFVATSSGRVVRLDVAETMSVAKRVRVAGASKVSAGRALVVGWAQSVSRLPMFGSAVALGGPHLLCIAVCCADGALYILSAETGANRHDAVTLLFVGSPMKWSCAWTWQAQS